MTVNNGVSSDIVATFADLPPPYSRRIGAIAHLANGQGYSVQAVAGVLTWVPDAGGGGGTVLKYVVAVAGSPQANAGTFPNVDAAATQAQIDFGPGNPIRAEIMCQPGSYPGFRLRPGMHVGMFVDGGIAAIRIPPQPNLDTPPLVFTGTVEVRAADGWNVGLGDPQPNASIANAKIATSGGDSCLQIGAGVTTGQVSLSRCVLTPETGIAIEEIAGALNIDALTISCENVQIEAFGSIPAPVGVAFNGVNVRLQLFDSCRVQGSLSTQQAEGITFSDSFMVRAPITASVNPPGPFTGSVNVRGIRSTMVSIGDALPLLVLNDGCTAAFDTSAMQPNGALYSIAGTGGSVLLQSGSLPGFERAPKEISIFSMTSGGSLAVPTAGDFPDMSPEGYISPIGAGPFAYGFPAGLKIEEIVFDLRLCTGPVTLTLPDVREAMQYTRLAVDRIDNNVVATMTVACTAPNELNLTAPATTSIAVAPLTRLSLVSSREPSSTGRWLASLSSAAGASLPDILYVTAQPAKYPGMSADVLTSLPAALTNPAVLAAAAAGGVSLVLLDDVYDVTAAATPTIPADLHLFAFSSGGARITSSAAQPTLFTAGNAKFENVSIENTGGLPAIRTTGNGTIDITGACEIVGDIDAATNDHALNLNLSGRVIVSGGVAGGATGALVIQSEDSVVGGVVGAAGSIQSHGGRYTLVLYTAAANITADNTTFGSLDTAGPVTLQSCSIGPLGAVTPPSSLTMRECQADGAVNTLTADVRGSTVSGLLTAQDLDLVNSSANGGVVSVGKCNVRFSSISGAMSSSSGAFDSFHNVFNGPVSSDGISDTGSEFRDTYTSTTAPSTFTGSYLFDVITLGAGQSAELRDCFVRVPVGATGAIVNAGGTVDLIDCYVRADDTFFSVSGTGNVRTTNRVSGGCRFDTSGGLVVLPTTSGVRARSQRGIDAPISVTSDDTIENLLGTAEVIDSVYLTPNANGWSVQEYPAAGFPMGYRHFVKNIGAFGVSIRPFGVADTIDGITFGGGGSITIAPNNFVELEKVSATGWQTCS